MDLLRSCYETEVRFYSGIEDTVRIRWSFVPEGTPFIAYPNNWVSSNWDNDPKPSHDLGELPEYGKSWASGLPIGNLPRDHACGSREQWSRGQALPPTIPVPVNDLGIPMCCFEGVPVPTPPPVVPPLLWVRADALAGLTDGDPISTWSGHDGAGGYAESDPAQQPAKGTDPTTGGPLALFPRGAITGLRILRPDPSIGPQGDFSVYLIGRGEATLAPTGPAVGLATPILSPQGKPQVRPADARIQLASPVIVWAQAVEEVWALWHVRRLGAWWQLGWNGIVVGQVEDGPAAATTGWDLFAYGATAAANLTAAVGEVLILPFCTDGNDHLAWVSYFRASWPIPEP